ncbi:hypothetical protein [Halorientalis marina]|jgi:hypothetical protein|uniref:hypothetical protein n=1 Tax=Halorientalis marina TaxID=2931976 RepID=UPI001FF4AFE3|nr:hypothetical protein [Halorientalis marina]
MTGLEAVVGEDPDYASMVVGTFVGVAGLLFLAEPVVDPVAVGGARVRMIALSVIVLAVGFGLGAGVYLRRGERLIGIAHAIGAGGWGLVALAPAVGSPLVLFLGFAILIGGALFLVAQTRRTP